MIALMYHDVVDDPVADMSGFPGRDAAMYKVSPSLFESHLDAIVHGSSGHRPPVITFDDGGVSAMVAAEILEQHGLRGCFFVTADYIDTPGFLSAAEMRELVERGHEVGSHSCSHPLRMGHCDRAQLHDEWTRSRDVISRIVGRPVTSASVPGGDFAMPVAEAAAAAGIGELFTSEPTARTQVVAGLTLHGRFTIRRWTSARTAAALAAGRFLPCAAQAVTWNLRKLGKRAAGERYVQVRQWMMREPRQVQWGDARDHHAP